jgi:hypothetical protein
MWWSCGGVAFGLIQRTIASDHEITFIINPAFDVILHDLQLAGRPSGTGGTICRLANVCHRLCDMLSDRLVDHGGNVEAYLGSGAFAGSDSRFYLGVKNVDAFVEVSVNVCNQLDEFIRHRMQCVDYRLVH